MRLPKSNTATKLLLTALLLLWGSAQAEPVGQVTNLSGPLFALNAQGARRILSIGSQVEPGETLITEDKTYAQVRFIDKGVVTLKPGTQFKIEAFAFEEKAPEKDGAVFGLLKGALRTVSGLVGKRGNQDAYKMNTATATIGIRGTQFLAEYVPEEEKAVSRVPYALPLLATLDARWIEAANGTLEDVPSGLFGLEAPPLQLAQNSPGGGGLAPGLYVHVIDGLINLSNRGGSQNFSAGQFGYTANVTQPPVIVPANPGLKFTPPPVFTTTEKQAAQAPAGASSPPPPPANQSDGCEVR